MSNMFVENRIRLLMASVNSEPVTPVPYDGLVWAYYDVTTTTAATRVIDNAQYCITGNYMYVDGVQVSKATTYQFQTTGRHLVKFPYNFNVSPGGYNVFKNLPELVEIYFPVATFTVCYRCFRSDTALTKVSFMDGSSVSLHGNGGQFNDCSTLPNLTIPASGDIPTCFVGCSSLERIEFNGSGTIGLGTNNCLSQTNVPKLKTVIFGAGYTSITGRLFSGSTVSRVAFSSTTPPTISSTAFNGWSVAHSIFVPYSQNHSILNAYKTATYWSTQASYMYELNPDGSLPEYTIFGSPSISDWLLTIPGGQNGIITEKTFNPGDKPWELQTKIIYKFTRYSEIIRSCDENGSSNGVYGIFVQMDNGGMRFIYSINGTSWVNTTGIQIQYTTDVWNWIKMGWDGRKFYHMHSLDGNEWTTLSYTNVNPVHSGEYILFGSTESNRYSQSTIDLSNTQILIDGKVWWKAVRQ